MDALLTLRTIKGKPLPEQIHVVEWLIDDPSLCEQVRAFIEDYIKSSVFEVRSDIEDRQLCKIVVLSVMLSDISTVPSIELRKPYLKIFQDVCDLVQVESIDISIFSMFVSTFENILQTIEKNESLH